MNATQTRTAKPVERTCRWMCLDQMQAREDLLCGRGSCLRLDIGDEIDVYEVDTIVNPAGKLEGFTMTKCLPTGDVASYTLSVDLRRCNCPHSNYRPNAQPCRHRAALAAALRRIGFEV